MALNMQDKRGLMDQILPEVQLNLTSAGITVTSDRIEHPITIPLDHSGKCPECKSTEMEVDYMVTKEGVTIWSSRLKKPRFVGFDCVYDLPGHTFIKIRNKARVYNIPHGIAEPMCVPKHISLPTPPPAPPVSQDKAVETLQLDEIVLPPPPPPPTIRNPAELAQEFLDNITAATTGMEFAAKSEPKQVATQVELKPNNPSIDAVSGISIDAMPREHEQQTMDEEKEWADVQDFMNSIAASTTGLNFASAGVQKMQTAEEMEEEKKAIEAIKSNIQTF